MTMFADIINRGALAEARHVFVFAGIPLTAPGVIGSGDPHDVFFGQLPVGAVRHAAQLACVYEQDFAPAVAKSCPPHPTLSPWERVAQSAG